MPLRFPTPVRLPLVVLSAVALSACGRDDLLLPAPDSLLSLAPATGSVMIGDSAVFRAWSGTPGTGTQLGIVRCDVVAPAMAVVGVRGETCVVTGILAGNTTLVATVRSGASVSIPLQVRSSGQP